MAMSFLQAERLLDIGGQFDSSTGTIAVRAVFNNANNLLRNGQTGTIKTLYTKEKCNIDTTRSCL